MIAPEVERLLGGRGGEDFEALGPEGEDGEHFDGFLVLRDEDGAGGGLGHDEVNLATGVPMEGGGGGILCMRSGDARGCARELLFQERDVPHLPD